MFFFEASNTLLIQFCHSNTRIQKFMIVTRFAPSPTGYLHLGGLRTALFCYLWARKNRGKFFLRIEDTDLQRNSQEATDAILEAFKWVGMDHDGDVVYQSNRLDLYQTHLKKLLEEGKAYYCYMPKEELDVLRQTQLQQGKKPKYDNRYREFTGTPPRGVDPVIRIKAPLQGEIVFHDGIKGENRIDAHELDDFIIARSDGTPTYNFVVAIDDALMGVTDVIRGDDHLSNTPKQLIVYHALGLTPPRFHHVPMILNPHGKKLSKRDGAMDVMVYKTMGYLPEALLNFLVRLGWSHGDQEIFSLEEMRTLFDPADINTSASAYNQEKLLWLNSHYLRNIPNNTLAHQLEHYHLFLSSHDKQEVLLDAVKERSKTLCEMAEISRQVIEPPHTYDLDSMKKAIKADTPEMLRAYIEYIRHHTRLFHLPIDYEEESNTFMKNRSLKMGKFGQPIRMALIGSAHGIAIYDIMAVLGVSESLRRIEHAIPSYESYLAKG
jgi:glutamyl-tRNA synthetase